MDGLGPHAALMKFLVVGLFIYFYDVCGNKGSVSYL
jgi:hypothetical protein